MSLRSTLRRLQPAPVVWREARDLVWRFRWRLLAGLALILVDRAAGLVLPATSKVLVDDVLGEGEHRLILPLAGAILGAALVQSGCGFALSRLLSLAAMKTVTELRQQIQRHVLRLPISAFDATRSGSLVTRILNDPEGIRNLVGTGLVQFVGSFFTAAAAFGILLWLDWRLTLVVTAFLGLFSTVIVLSFVSLRPLYRERNEIRSEVSGRLTEALAGIRIVKAYTAERREDLVFARGSHRLLRNGAQTLDTTAAVSAATKLLTGAIGATLLVLGSRAVLEGRMTLGDLVSFVFFTGMLSGPLMNLAGLASQINEAFAGLDRIRELRRKPTEEAHDRERSRIRDVAGEVRFEGVSFAYRPGLPVLHEVDLDAPAGTTVALVGPSGAGKTTLMTLVAGFHHPSAGRVLVDGHDLATLRSRDVRSHLGVVLQENFLFDGTVAENIGYSRPGASREEIERVARIAHVEPFVRQFPDGYDTVVGERGIKLSGGQRQRVAIARAILADPAILLLDEATSSLDSESEALIQDGLARLRKGRTSFVIAHRLSTIRSADQILVLDEGRIVERGTHEELLARGGRYRRLHDEQTRLR